MNYCPDCHMNYIGNSHTCSLSEDAIAEPLPAYWARVLMQLSSENGRLKAENEFYRVKEEGKQ